MHWWPVQTDYMDTYNKNELYLNKDKHRVRYALIYSVCTNDVELWALGNTFMPRNQMFYVKLKIQSGRKIRQWVYTKDYVLLTIIKYQYSSCFCINIVHLNLNVIYR